MIVPLADTDGDGAFDAVTEAETVTDGDTAPLADALADGCDAEADGDGDAESEAEADGVSATDAVAEREGISDPVGVVLSVRLADPEIDTAAEAEGVTG